MVWRPDDPQGNEAGKIAPFIVPYTRGRGLDIGCGPFKAFPHFIGVDSGKGWKGQDIRRDWVETEADDISLFADGSMDFVFSSHLLEHIEDTEKTLAEWWRVIRPGGHLVLYLPHRAFYPNCGGEGANPDHKHDFLPSEIQEWMETIAHDSGISWTLIENEERNETNEYSFFQIYRKGAFPDRRDLVRTFSAPWRRQPKSCLVVRYGAFGDHIMASSALRALKAEGWHVTYNCDARGHEALREDPHIDAWLVQDTDQVPNHLLGPYWNALATRYDRVLNLSQSVEETLLAVPGRLNHGWPDEVRRKLMGSVNYLDRTHDLCGVARGPRPEFFPDGREKMWAQKQYKEITKGQKRRGGRLDKLSARPIVMWAMSGSSVHKVWPHMDAVIAALMLRTDAIVVLTGAPGIDEILEAGWENEDRVLKRTGKWSIRETLTFAKLVADVVVGPETGILNAVSHEDSIGKVVYLSHSSPVNLTRDWVRTKVLVPPGSVACYPCHRMHYSFEHCHRSEATGTALCASSIEPSRVLDAIASFFPKERSAAA